MLVSQGRIGDRCEGAIAGAALTADALAARHGLPRSDAGTPAAPLGRVDWRLALDDARTQLQALSALTEATLQAGARPLLLANTCSASLATLPVAARHHPGLRVLWIDAHGDFNTPATTASGYLGGMALSGGCGLWDSGLGGGIDPELATVVGGRDIDPAEAELLQRSGVRVLAPAQSTPEAVLAGLGDAPLWVHIDWDALEPGHVPTDYRVPGGLRPEQLRAILAAIPRRQLAGLELAEFVAAGDAAGHAQAVARILHAVEPVLADG